MADPTTDPALSMCFTVQVDSYDLGTFMSCEGLGMELVLQSQEEGGNNSFVHQLPVRLKHTNIKLTRPLGPASEALVAWFTKLATEPVPQRGTAAITALRADGSKVAAWSLEGVLPVRWTGPTLNVETNKAATETLELTHHGFKA